MLFFYLAWRMACRTIFSFAWWKERWYLPWLFMLGILGWVVSGGRGSVVSLTKKTNEIRSKERGNVIDIRKKHIEREAQIEREVRRRKAEIRTQSVKDLEELKARIKKERELLSGDSEAINKDLNDALDD
jgi:cobalamin-dependent methionine synthase I